MLDANISRRQEKRKGHTEFLKGIKQICDLHLCEKQKLIYGDAKGRGKNRTKSRHE